jgi:hypothetical protein
MNACDVTLHWRSLVSPPPDYDPELKSVSSPVEAIENGGTSDTETIRALVHYVKPSTTGFQRFQEVEQGDVILDILADTDFSGKQDLRFEIGGVFYVQKPQGRDLARSWDTRHGDEGIFRTLLLRIQE